MKFNKPTVEVLGDAVSVILGQPKTLTPNDSPFSPNAPNVNPAYELDE